MSLGRIVRVRGIDASGNDCVKAFDVAIEDQDVAITAVKVVHPKLTSCHMQADERLSQTAVAFLDLRPGEVRERHASLLVELTTRS